MSKEKEIKIEGENIEESNVDEQTADNASENTENTENTDDNKEAEPQLTPLEEAQQENAKLKDQLLRTIAEFDNYKKRTIKEKAELILNGGKKTITAILPVLDDFERAIADKNEDAAATREGMELIFHKFIKTLESLGVQKIDTEDADFNVDYHEAIAMVPGMGDEKKGKVIDCVQTGYTLNDQVIRHAKVAVGQ
jgi:molecular chaperone GrpE